MPDDEATSGAASDDTSSMERGDGRAAGSLAMLIPARRLGRRAYRLGASMAWALPLFLCGLVLAGAPVKRFVAPGASVDINTLASVLGCGNVCFGSFVLLFVTCFLFVMLRFRRAFRVCYEKARAREAAGSPSVAGSDVDSGSGHGADHPLSRQDI